jgi:hypothetical protein
MYIACAGFAGIIIKAATQIDFIFLLISIAAASVVYMTFQNYIENLRYTTDKVEIFIPEREEWEEMQPEQEESKFSRPLSKEIDSSTIPPKYFDTNRLMEKQPEADSEPDIAIDREKETPKNETLYDSVFREFELPSHVRVACEQYLLFFVEFLRDLGVNATSDLRHEAGKVLFTVTPDDKKVSLDKIRTALEVYLELPKKPYFDEENQTNGVREIKYIQEVTTLKMRLSVAEIQLKTQKQLFAKEKEIVAEKERVIQVLSLFTKSIIEETKNSTQMTVESNKKTKLLKGVVEIGGKIKIKEGIEIDVQRFLELTNLDSVFFELEEYLNAPLITELKLNEKSE